MANDLHGRLDNVMAADFCRFPFFNGHSIFRVQSNADNYSKWLPDRTTMPHGKKRQQREWLLPTQLRPGHVQEQQVPSFTPAFLSMKASGQKPVTPLCARLAPTKTVSQSQAGLLPKWARARLSSTIRPATRCTVRSTVIRISFC